MASFAKFGNDLYTGKRSYDIVGSRKIWYMVGAIIIIIAIVGPWLRGGFVFGIEFSGGSEFQVERVEDTTQSIGEKAVTDVVPKANPRVTTVGGNNVRIQTDTVTDNQALEIKDALATAYNVPPAQVNSSFIGATWGQDVTAQSIRALVVFILLAGAVMALYFRTWKMSLAALIALGHDLIVVAGVYGILGFEVTPAAVIGFLTILGYSLYDTVVVFDKVRENTAEAGPESTRTFGELVNLAVNQTLVRSINTSVVAVLPVAAILFIGAFVLGAGTLRDISLALFIGIIAGTYSTIFIATPIYAHLREKEEEIVKRDKRVLAARKASLAAAVAE